MMFDSRLFVSTLTCLVFSLPNSLVAAQQRASASNSDFNDSVSYWLPASPVPQEFDWVQLVSGEWLKGKLLSLYNLNLEFDSEKLDTLSLHWEDVSELRTHNEFEVLFRDKSTAIGRIFIQQDQIQVVAEEPIRKAKQDIVSIAPTATSLLSAWEGDVALAINWRRGNTEQQDITFRANTERRTARNRFKSSFKSSRSEVEGDKVENSRRFVTSMDWFVSPRWFLRPLHLEYFSDVFQNIDRRTTYTAAIGSYLVDNSRAAWDVYLGPGYQITRFENTPNGSRDKKETSTLSLGTSYSLEVTSGIDLDMKYDGQRVSEEAGEFNHHAEIGLAIDLMGDFDLDLRYNIDRIQKPVAESGGDIPEKQDSLLTLGISYDF